MAAAKFPRRLLQKKPKKRKMSELNPMSRRPVTRNSVRANARLVVIAGLVNRANPVRQGSLVNHVAANVRLLVDSIAVTADQATVAHATLIVQNAAAANAAVAVTVEIVANVRRCASAPRWIETVDRAMTAADAGLQIATVDRATVTVADAKIVPLNVDRANTIVLAKATVVLVITTVLRPVVVVVAANAIMIARLNAAVNAISASAIVITRPGVIPAPARAAMSDAIILRAAEVAAVEAAKRDQQFQEAGFGPPFLFH
jgi:hypothetical protein